MLKDGDRFLQELAQKRHEADKRQRLVIFQLLMANADNDLCPKCGANIEVWQEMGLGEHNHY